MYYASHAWYILPTLTHIMYYVSMVHTADHHWAKLQQNVSFDWKKKDWNAKLPELQKNFFFFVGDTLNHFIQWFKNLFM